MKNENRGSSEESFLRQKAEKLSRKKSILYELALSDSETLKLFHELQVHQIELEIQNEELRRLRDKAEAATKKYSALYDFAPAGYFTLDPEGHILELNHSGASLLGMNRLDLLNTSFSKFVASASIPLFEEFLRRVFRNSSKQTVQLKLRNHMNPLYYVFLEGIVSDGELQCFVTAFDINKLIKSENIINQNIGAWELNLITGEAWRSLKHDQIFGYDSLLPEWTFDIFIEHVLPEDRALVKESFDVALATGSDWNFECRICRIDGNISWIWATGKPEYNENNDPVLISGIVQDRTDLKNAQEILYNKIHEITTLNRKLENANQELSQFAYTASHQLQEPIRTVSNYMKIIEEDYSHSLDGDALKFIHIVNDAAKRIGSLINSLMAYSRLGYNLTLSMVDCRQLIDNVIDDLKYIIVTSEAAIEISEMPVIKIYEVEIRQLFQNLITNAIKFQAKDSKPEIRISAEKINRGWKFSVRDNGIGISPEHFDRIFDIFQRLQTDEDEYKGKGIGLAYCKKIVLLHQGELWVESTPGKGSVFCFTIPELIE